MVLATIPMAVIARQTRSAMLEVLSEDYVRTAKAKGLPPLAGGRPARPAQRLDPGGHGDRPAGRRAARRAILTETIFSWPGVGKWMVDSIFRRDYPSVQGGLLMIAAIVMMVNMLVDLLYGLINPRIRRTG